MHGRTGAVVATAKTATASEVKGKVAITPTEVIAKTTTTAATAVVKAAVTTHVATAVGVEVAEVTVANAPFCTATPASTPLLAVAAKDRDAPTTTTALAAANSTQQ